MDVTQRVDCLHADYEDGKVTFGTYISTDTDVPSEIDDAVVAWANGDNASIELRFSISDCITDMIEGHSYGFSASDPDAPPIFGEESKPMIDALRAELLAAIERLDSIEFTPPL